MHFQKIFLAGLLFALFSAVVYSQNSIIEKEDSTGIYKMTDVVVTATRTQTPLIELASSVSVIDSTEIANSNSTNVFDLLKNETGISFTRQGGSGTLSNIYVRGANADQVLVLIDGVEVNLTNDPSGVYDFSELPLDNIQRIEVLRGPQSTLYGSDALAGVINIITKKGSGPAQFSILTEAGSYNTYKALFGINGLLNRLNYSLTLSRTGSDGFSNASSKYGNTEKDGYNFNNLSSVVGYDLNDFTQINLFTRFTKSKSDYDQFGGKFGDDPTYVFNQEEFSIRGEGIIKLLEGDWNQKFGLSFIRNVRNYSFDTSASSHYYPEYIYDYSWSSYDGRRYKLDWQNDFKVDKVNLLTLGTEYEVEQSSAEYYALNYVPDPFYPDITSIIPEKETATLGIFLQDQINFNDRLFASLGVRLDHHNKFGSQSTYRISPAYMFWETGTKLKGTIGTGFKAPSLYYLYDPAYGNEDLNPEKSFGWELGIEQYFFGQGLSIGATYFYNKFTDMFGFDYQTFKTININEALTKGIELYLDGKISDELNFKMNYTYTDARDISPASSNYNKKLVRRPENKAGLFVDYNFNSRTDINTSIIWVGSRQDINFATYERITLQGYLLVNLAGHYDLFDFLQLNARLENLLNTDYEEVYGYATPGFSLYGGFKLKL
jgi:vitamin B12 transporter